MNGAECQLCVICRKIVKNVKVSSTPNGQQQIIKAANIRRDQVFERLQLLPEDATFYYHLSNECYKAYVHKRALEKLADNNKSNDVVDRKRKSSESAIEQRQSKRLSTDSIQISDKCVVCGQNAYNNVKKKLEITNERADCILKAAKFLKDEVHFRIASYETASQVVAAKLKCHRVCLKAYNLKYQRSIKPSDNKENGRCSDIDNAIKKVIKAIEPKIKLGEVFSLKDVSNLIVQEHGFSVKNSKIKSLLIDNFGESICFVYPNEKNKSQIFYFTREELRPPKSHNETVIDDYIKKLKNCLHETNFDLEDRFCDAHDLEKALKNMKIPDLFLSFFSKLFDCKKIDIINDETELTDDITLPKILKVLRIKTLFQIMCFIKHNTTKKTPFHCLLGSYVYYNSKSKNIVSALNRCGLSVSYEQVIRTRARLAEYTKNCSPGIVPLPSHFNKTDYVVAAMDNFDHNEATVSGLGASHDAAIILIQDENVNNFTCKPKLSECGLNKRIKTFASLLPCQEIKHYIKRNKSIELPPDYEINNELNPVTITDYTSKFRVADHTWVLSRIDFSNTEIINIKNANQVVPSWSPCNSAVVDDKRSIQKVAYPPVVPAPITEEATVYTCLCNMNDVLSQLDQEFLVVTCDEGVYRIARAMKLANPEKFKKLIVCIGGFHLIKVVQGCPGIFMKGSGLENVYYETELFGLNVVDQIFNALNYNRTTKGLSYLYEAYKRLQFQAFFEEMGLDKYENEINYIISLQETFAEENLEEAKQIFNDFQYGCSGMMQDFEKFVERRCEESELFKYHNIILILIGLMFDLVRADRTGDWNLHITTIRKLIPIFLALDRTNYARWCSMYLEDMMNLAKTAPEVYQQFLKGRFTVKQSSIPFTSVPIDQALEQSINRTSKDSHKGVIGITRKKEAVAVWNLTFHEYAAISNYFKNVIHFSNNDEEVFNHHEFSPTTTENSEIAVQTILDYLEDKKCNPFMPGSQKLRNLVTGELVHPETAKKILNVFEKGLELYSTFRKERFIDRTKPISATISRYNMPRFKDIPKTELPKSAKKQKITTSQTQKILALARERNYPIEKLLTYDLTYKNMLFDDSGLFVKYDKKSSLVTEMEKTYLHDKPEFSKIESDTCLVVDVMLVLRQTPWKELTNFDGLADRFCSLIAGKASLQTTKRIDFVFDSYFEQSIKSSEHLRRVKNPGVFIHNITGKRLLPKNPDEFWGISENKILLQKFLQEYIDLQTVLFKDYDLVFSTINDYPCVSNTDNSIAMLQRHDIEEADLKIILHIKNAIDHGLKNIYLISSDTDVIVLVLFFFKTFKDNGLQTLWVSLGISKNAKHIPIHKLADHYGEDFCSTLLALHHLTGSDYTSKVGTKYAALHSQPQNYLLNFADDYSESSIERDIKRAEEWLVKVWKVTSKSKTFDEERIWAFNWSQKSSLIEDLPATSQTIHLHIRRAFYVVFLQKHVLNKRTDLLNPLQFGWKEQDDMLVPETIQILLPPPDELVFNCTGETCTRNSCICVANGIPCCSFCECQKSKKCKNKYNCN